MSVGTASYQSFLDSLGEIEPLQIGGASTIVRPGELIEFETDFVFGKGQKPPRVAFSIDNLVLTEVTCRRQKPRSGPNAIAPEDMPNVAWDDPRVMYVIELIIAGLGYKLGILGENGEFDALNDPVMHLFVDTPKAEGQTPTIYGQHLRANDDAVLRLHELLKSRDWQDRRIQGDAINPGGEDASMSSSKLEWRLAAQTPDHMEGSYGRQMRYRAHKSGLTLASIEMRPSNPTNNANAFEDLFKAHIGKLLIVAAGQKPTATEAQKDNLRRFLGSITGAQFDKNEERMKPGQPNGGQYVTRGVADKPVNSPYTDQSIGQQWPTRANVPVITVRGATTEEGGDEAADEDVFSFWSQVNAPQLVGAGAPVTESMVIDGSSLASMPGEADF